MTGHGVPSNVEKEYPLRFRSRSFVVLFGATSALFALFAVLAWVYNWGLFFRQSPLEMKYGIVRPILGPSQTLNLFVIIAAVAFLTAVLLGLKGIAGSGHPKRVAFTPTSIIMPKGRWGRAEVALDYAGIKRLRVQRFTFFSFLEILHTKGTFGILLQSLPSQETFTELTKELEARVAVARTRSQKQ